MPANNDGRQADPEIPDVLPLLPIRDLVVFPYMIVPLRVTRPVSMEAVTKALEADERLCFLVAQRNSGEDDPGPNGFYRTGTIGMIMRMRKLSEGGLKVLVQGLCRARIQKFTSESPCYRVRIERTDDRALVRSVSLEALLRSVRQNIDKLSNLGKTIQPELSMVVQSVDDPGRMADLVSSNLTLKVTEAQDLLELEEPVQRLTRVNQTLEKEIGILEVQSQIQNKAREEMSKTQRDYYLREQLRQIKTELGDGDVHGEEIEELRAKIVRAGLPEEARIEADKQVRRLDQMHAESAEAAVLRTYIDWLAELPWNTSSEDTLDIETARKILDEDHYDLEHIKDRILDYLAVRKLRAGAHGPILCFLGPPGVGKTSLGRSIARALGRKFVRISLGGVRDEAEIRGHRRTYVGSLPGRLIQGMKKAGSHNPVFMLDEIDKLGHDFRGDPAAALLEVLDPEQNHNFSDHYLEVPFDLSKVMFVATANIMDPIPPALRDRLEVLELPGYTREEKLNISKHFLIPKQLEEHGLTAEKVVFDDSAVAEVIDAYTREAGVRNLEREVANVVRAIAVLVAEGKAQPVERLTAERIAELLGPAKHISEVAERTAEPGVATGLAWTPVGGDILFIEATKMNGKGSLVLTGQLGDVMKESAQAALSFIRSRAKWLGLEENFLEKTDIHVHIPAGAIPKDGPSAGVTMFIAMASLLTGKPIRNDVAMTGEITLRGLVLPVGGIKEKFLAAHRAGIKRVILPERNRKDVIEIPEQPKKEIEILFVKRMDELLPLVLTEMPKLGAMTVPAMTPPSATPPPAA